MSTLTQGLESLAKIPPFLVDTVPQLGMRGAS